GPTARCFSGAPWPGRAAPACSLRAPGGALSPSPRFAVPGRAGTGARARAPRRRRDGIVMAAAVAVIVWLALSVHDWRAGGTGGPRPLVGMLPFPASGGRLALPLLPRAAGGPARAAPRPPGLLFRAAVAVPAFDVNFPFPITEQAFFLLKEGIVSPNPALALGIPGAWSLLLPALLAAGALLFALAEAVRGRARLDLTAAVAAFVVLGAGSRL